MNISKKFLAGLMALSLALCLSAPAQAAAVLVDNSLSYSNETGPLSNPGNLEAEFSVSGSSPYLWNSSVTEISQNSSTIYLAPSGSSTPNNQVTFSFGYDGNNLTLTIGDKAVSTNDFSTTSGFSSFFFGVNSSNLNDTNTLYLSSVTIDNSVQTEITGGIGTGSGEGTETEIDLLKYFKEYTFKSEEGEPLIFSTFLVQGFIEMEATTSNTPLTAHVGVTSATPIPAAAWLLGSGLLGLVGIRRKFMA